MFKKRDNKDKKKKEKEKGKEMVGKVCTQQKKKN